MYSSPLRDAWVSSLPIGGVDGSLVERFGKAPYAGHIHAKTGSVAGVAALAGYILPPPIPQRSGIAFAIFMNNGNMTHSAAAAVIDRIVEEIYNTEVPSPGR